MFYQLGTQPGYGSKSLHRVFLKSKSVKVVEEYEEWESEAEHSSPNHSWPVHQHIQTSDSSRITVQHCSAQSIHLLRGNVRFIFSGERLPEMQVHRRERTDWRGTKTDGIRFQTHAVGLYLQFVIDKKFQITPQSGALYFAPMQRFPSIQPIPPILSHPI